MRRFPYGSNRKATSPVMKSSLVKFTTAAAMIGTLAVAIATTPEARDGAGAFAAGVGLGLLGSAAIASATHSAPACALGTCVAGGYHSNQ
jgi:hypothetical protein